MADLHCFSSGGNQSLSVGIGTNAYCNVHTSSGLSQSITNNTSTIKYDLWATAYISNPGVTYVGTTRPNAGYLDLVIDGKVVKTISVPYQYGETNGRTIASTSGNFTVSHNNDGTKTINAYIRIRTGTDQLRWGYVYAASESGHAKWQIKTIPRASIPSLSTSIPTVGTAFTVNTNRKSSSFTHSMWYRINSEDWIDAGTDIEESISLTIPESVFDAYGTENVLPVTIRLRTFNGSTQIGSDQNLNFSLQAASDMVPTIQSATIEETNANVSAVNGDVVVRYLSSKKVNISGSAKHGASVSRIEVINGTVTKTINTASGSVTFTNPNSGVFSIKVIDSRNLQATLTKTLTYYEYNYPTIKGSVARSTPTGNGGTLSMTGTYWNGLGNTTTIQYKRNDKNTLSASTTNSNGSASATVNYTDLEYNKAFRWTISIVDSFNQVGTAEVVLAVSTPTLWIGKDNVLLNGHSLGHYMYPVGSVYITTSEINPGTLPMFEGTTWVQFSQGRTLIGAGTGTDANNVQKTFDLMEAGGEYENTLVTDQIPSHTHTIAMFSSKDEASGYGLTKTGGFANRVLVTRWGSGQWSTYSTGGGKAHNNIQPYIAVYFWRRTA